ncbi:hypothetical protein Q5752_003046 [Cryptotrichosporon argae]
MAVASSSSGRIPQGEVIMEFADGGQYIRNKLENAVIELERRRIEKSEGLKASRALEALEVAPADAAKEEHMAFIVRELGISKAQAEAALREEKDVVKALLKLTAP